MSEVKDGIAMGKKEKTDVVVGFGGGSALDAAKAIAVGIGYEEDIEEFFDGRKEHGGKTLPIMAIPTTAGTGSESSKAAIITDDEREIKGGIRGAALYPEVAIVDSLFTETVPLNITVETGFDVFAHAVESYISKAATPYTEMQSEYAIRIVGKYLPKLMCNTCLPHRLQYPVGAHTDTSHGKGLAALFPAWMNYEYQYSPDKLKKVFELLFGKNCQDGMDVVQSIDKFISGLRLPTSLHEIGVEGALIDRMINEVTGSIKNDPAAQDDHIIEKIYRTAF